MDAIDREPTPTPTPSIGPVKRLVALARRGLNFAIDAGTFVWRIAVNNLFTVPALFLSVILLFVLPQTANLLWQPPALSGMTLLEMILSLMLTAYLPALLILYVILARSLEAAPAEPEGGRLVTGWFRRASWKVGNRLDAPLVRASTRGTGRGSRLGWSLAVLALVLAGVTRFLDDFLPTWWRVSGSTYATMIGMVGVWILASPSGGDLGTKTRVTGRAMILFVATMLAGQFLWLLTDQLPSLLSPRVYTIWAIIQICFLLVITARVVDVCHGASAWNIRGMVTLGVVVLLLAMPSQQIGRFWRLPPRPSDRGAAAPTATAAAATTPSPSAQVPAAGAGPIAASRSHQSPTLSMEDTLVQTWFESVETRIAATDPDKPLIFVSASGGGARAAMFTALVLESLRHTPLYPNENALNLVFPSNGSDSQRIRAEKRLRTLADQIVLISSVSGGSLASAYYVSQNYPHLSVQRGRGQNLDSQIPQLVPPARQVRNTWRNAFPNDLYSRMRDRAFVMLDETRLGRGRSVSNWAGSRFDEAVERVAYECERLASGTNTLKNAKAEAEPIAPWLSTSAFVDDMSTDFMAPLLRGLLNPGLERGVSVTRFWESEFGWRDVEDLDLHRQPHPTHPELGVVYNGAPVVLFNTCDVAQGSRLVLGFPPVPPGLIRDPLARPTSHLAYALADRGDLYYHVSLAEAVRLSANFPFGFEVGRLPLSEGDDTILALDGGIVDNSGIDSIVFLIQGLSRQAATYRRDWEVLADLYAKESDPTRRAELREQFRRLTCESIAGRSYRLLAELAKRRVVLVQIDSGTKEIQTRNSGFSQLLAGISPVIFRPFQALNNASYTNAEQAIEQYDMALGILQPLPEPIACDAPGGTGTPYPTPAPTVEAPAPAKVIPAPQAPAKVAPAPQGPLPPVEFGIPRPVPPYPTEASSILRVRLTCNQSANIMTAWTLGPEDKARVLVQFLIEWQHQKPVVEAALGIQTEKMIRYSPAPGMIPATPVGGPLSSKFGEFSRGQRLVDRARSEFYQSLFAPGASGGVRAILNDPVLDEYSRQDIQAYDRILERNAKEPVPGPMPLAAPAAAVYEAPPAPKAAPAMQSPPR